MEVSHLEAPKCKYCSFSGNKKHEKYCPHEVMGDTLSKINFVFPDNMKNVPILNKGIKPGFSCLNEYTTDFCNVYRENTLIDFINIIKENNNTIHVDCCLFLQVYYYEQLLHVIGFGINMSWLIFSNLPKNIRPLYYTISHDKINKSEFDCLSKFSGKGQWLAPIEVNSHIKYLGMSLNGPRYASLDWWHNNIIESLTSESKKFMKSKSSTMGDLNIKIAYGGMMNCFLKMDKFKKENYVLMNNYNS